MMRISLKEKQLQIHKLRGPGASWFFVYFFRHRYSAIAHWLAVAAVLIPVLAGTGCATVPPGAPEGEPAVVEQREGEPSREDLPRVEEEGDAAPVEVPQGDGVDGAEGFSTDHLTPQDDSAARENRLAMVLPPAVDPRVPEIPDPVMVRDPVDQMVEAIVSGMTVEQLAGQLLMPALPTAPGGGFTVSMHSAVRNLLETVQPGGIILFGGNLRTPEQVRALIQDLQEFSAVPLLVGVDQEGGVVSRLTSSSEMNATVVPPASRVGRTGDPELAYEVARAVARELRSLGITMNFAPVADVLTNRSNTAIGSRAFGEDPELVAGMVAATVRGLQDEGVSAVVKHFPGHGDTREDTHLQAVVVPHSLDRLRSVELVPFRSGIAAGADGVMTAHITLPEVSGPDLPATLSRRILRDLLRDELGYSGVIVTDSLVMAALTRYFPEDRLPLKAFQAGADMLLYPRDARAAHAAMVEAVARGTVTREDLEESAARILRIKAARGLLIPRAAGAAVEDSDGPGIPVRDTQLFDRPAAFFPDEHTLGAPEHRAVMDRVLEAATATPVRAP